MLPIIIASLELKYLSSKLFPTILQPTPQATLPSPHHHRCEVLQSWVSQSVALLHHHEKRPGLYDETTHRAASLPASTELPAFSPSQLCQLRLQPTHPVLANWFYLSSNPHSALITVPTASLLPGTVPSSAKTSWCVSQLSKPGEDTCISKLPN